MNRLLAAAALGTAVLNLSPASAQPAPPTPPGVAQGTSPAPMPMRHVPPVVHSPVRVQTAIMQRSMTRNQLLQHVRMLFSRFDTNHDGYITKDEVAALHVRMMGMRDAIGHGGRDSMDHQPMPMAPGAMFDRIDANHDGVISREEFNTAHARMQERRVVIMRSGSREGGDMAGHLFEMADTNHDGRVSLQEAETAALAHFDRMDRNRDGRITPDERRQGRDMMRQHRPG